MSVPCDGLSQGGGCEGRVSGQLLGPFLRPFRPLAGRITTLTADLLLGCLGCSTPSP